MSFEQNSNLFNSYLPSNYPNSDFNDPNSQESITSNYLKNLFEQRRIENQLLDEMIEIDPFHIFKEQTSVPRAPRAYINRDREDAHNRLFNDYFASNPLFPLNMFRRRFRMRRDLFCRVVDAVTTNDDYFIQKPDATGRLGASSLQKCTTTIRLLAYGTSTNSLEEYLKISGAVARESLHHFVEGVITQFDGQYLRKPTEEDMARLLWQGEKRGFPGMMGSIDCMHWEWKNCPTGLRAQFQGRSKKATLILEVVASYDLWIWHAFFGTPGSCNDINVLYRSPLFDDIFEGHAPPVQFVVNGNQYNMGYYLTDGIYPTWASFIQPIRVPVFAKHSLFNEVQERVRKDVERAFGVIQARFAIISNPALCHNRKMLGKIMKARIILHNMIVEDERDTYKNYSDMTEFQNDAPESSNSRLGRNVDPFTFAKGGFELTKLHG